MAPRLALAASVLLLARLGITATPVLADYVAPPPFPPTVSAVDPWHLLFDHTPVYFTITDQWQKFPMVVPAYRFESDFTLWRRMSFEDWDTVPAAIREPALRRMIARYRWVLEGPDLWRWMDADQWDGVPQPIRAVAYLGMANYWTAYYAVGRNFDLPPGRVARTLGAIIMAESWFEHRAVTVNPWGNRDLGLGQASDYCRRTLEQWYKAGSLDFKPTEASYFSPWLATRAAAVWFDRLLTEADGNVDLAVRAYHRGINRARAGDGADYAANVERKRARFMENRNAPPSWRFVFARIPPAEFRIAKR